MNFAGREHAEVPIRDAQPGDFVFYTTPRGRRVGRIASLDGASPRLTFQLEAATHRRERNGRAVREADIVSAWRPTQDKEKPSCQT
jgi:hypothetical protein